MRPLVYEYPADKHVRNISDEYMLGSFVLVAPVIARARRQERFICLTATGMITTQAKNTVAADIF